MENFVTLTGCSSTKVSGWQNSFSTSQMEINNMLHRLQCKIPSNGLLYSIFRRYSISDYGKFQQNHINFLRFPKQIIYFTKIFVYKTWTVIVVMNLIGLIAEFGMSAFYLILCTLEIRSSDLPVQPPVVFLWAMEIPN